MDAATARGLAVILELHWNAPQQGAHLIDMYASVDRPLIVAKERSIRGRLSRDRCLIGITPSTFGTGLHLDTIASHIPTQDVPLDYV